jgi:hypothetical protein
MGVPFTFAGQAGPIPLAELDADFAFVTPAILVDTSVTPSVITVSLQAGIPIPVAYTTGLVLFILVANTTTTTTPTINLNGIGAKTIVNADGSALTVGQIVAGQIIEVVYDGTNFRLIGGASSPTSGVFTITGVGFSGAAPTMPATWRMRDSVVTLHFASTGVNAPSNSTSFSFTGIPAALQPTFLTQEFRVGAIDASAEVNDASVQIGTTTPGSFNMLRNGLLAGWTATGNKGFGAATITYLLS